MARMTIYIPDDLKVAMMRFDDRLSWSALARQAFERAVKREQQKEEGNNGKV